jgi:hypothetical protein
MFQDGIYQGTYLPHFICDKTMEMIGEKNRQIFHSRHSSCRSKTGENR